MSELCRGPGPGPVLHCLAFLWSVHCLLSFSDHLLVCPTCQYCPLQLQYLKKQWLILVAAAIVMVKMQSGLQPSPSFSLMASDGQSQEKRKKAVSFYYVNSGLGQIKTSLFGFFFFQKWSNSDCYLKNGAIEGLQSYPVHYGDFWLLVFAMISGGQRLATRRLVKINSMGLQCPL